MGLERLMYSCIEFWILRYIHKRDTHYIIRYGKDNYNISIP